MNNISWKENTFISKGVVIENIPTITKPKKRITTYTIPGRNGVLNVDEGTYDPISLTLNCHFQDGNANILELNNWLDGFGKLSLDGIKYYEGIINNNIPYEQITNFKKFQINFQLNPIQKKIIPTTNVIDISEATNTIEVGGTTNTYPTITIEGEGQLIVRINEITFTLDNADGEYILDSEAKEIIHNNQSAMSIMSGDFPYLVPGDNEIFISGTGTYTSMSITYNESYL